jgi:hypothetical protein
MGISSLSLPLPGENGKSSGPIGRDCVPVELNPPHLGKSRLTVLVDCLESAGERGQVICSSWKRNQEAALGGHFPFVLSRPFASSDSSGG